LELAIYDKREKKKNNMLEHLFYRNHKVRERERRETIKNRE
jgi:hypothetical protein